MDTQISNTCSGSNSFSQPPATSVKSSRVKMVGVGSLSVPSQPDYTSDQKLHAQRALDRYHITVADILKDTNAFQSGVNKFFSNVKVVLFPNLYLLPRYVPVIPLMTFCYYGPVKATLGLAVVGGVVGGIGFAYSWFNHANELYNATPLHHLSNKKLEIQNSSDRHAKNIIEFRCKRFDVAIDWMWKAPSEIDWMWKAPSEIDWQWKAPSGMEVGAMSLPLLDKQDDFIGPTKEERMSSIVSFCQQEIESQKAKVHKLSEEVKQLQGCELYHEKCQLHISKDAMQIEVTLLQYFEGYLKYLELQKIILDKREGANEGSVNDAKPVIEGQRPVVGASQGKSIKDLRQELVQICGRCTAADMELKQEQHLYNDAVKQYAEAVVDNEYMPLAFSQEMKTKINWNTSNDEANKLRNLSPPTHTAVNTSTDVNAHFEPS